jgi:Predicted nucleotide-binding protein containing TIR-like domain
VFSGDAVYATLERVATECDAAIVLATPDDLGRLATDITDSPRARQNVWMELGWFWARLGRRRTLLLIKGEIDVPSNYHGIIYQSYRSNLSEISDSLNRFFKSLRTLDPDYLTELVYLSSDPSTREKHWKEVHNAAMTNLIITGISMGAVRHMFSSILESMRDKLELTLDLVVVHPRYTHDNLDLFEKQHRPGAVRDNHSFFSDLLMHIQNFEDVADRVRLFLYNGFPPFAAVVADGPGWGSTMIAQQFVPNPQKHSFNHPRFKLRRRTREGVYVTYWNAVEELIKHSEKPPIRGLKEIEKVVAEIASFTH